MREQGVKENLAPDRSQRIRSTKRQSPARTKYDIKALKRISFSVRHPADTIATIKRSHDVSIKGAAEYPLNK